MKKLLILVVLILVTVAGWARASTPVLSVVNDTQPAVEVAYALGKLSVILDEADVAHEVVQSVEQARGERLLLAGLGAGDGDAAAWLDRSGRALSGGAESFVRWQTDIDSKPAWITVGGDNRGLVYALQDIAETLAWSDEADPLDSLTEASQSPDVGVRAVSMYTMNRRYWESRFYDEDYWRRYMDTLIESRFNTLVLIFGYENDSFLAPCYPYFFDVPGFPDVGMPGMTAQEQQRNLAALNRMVEMAHERGLDFKVAIWDHISRHNTPGDAVADHQVRGVSRDNLYAYTTAAFARLIELVPGLDGVQFRMHNESGLEPGREMEEFWTAMFGTIRDQIPDLRIELRAKELPDAIIAIAEGMGLNYAVTTKYWMEQMGLPFHPTHINRQNQFDRRHGYADMLRHPKTFDIHWRLWTAGTHRVLLWGNPDYVRRFAASTHLYDGIGFEINEPLATKMDGQPHDVEPFDLLNPKYRYYQDEFERYWYYFKVFGRIAYNPELNDDVLAREFTRRFGDEAGPLLREALHQASMIMPMINAAHAHYGVFPTTRGWMAKQRIGNLAEFAKGEGSDIQQFASFDEAARLMIEGGETAKRLPAQTSAWLTRAAANIRELVRQARAKTAEPAGNEFISTVTDLNILANIALYHAHRGPAAVSYRVYERSGDVHALDDAIAHEAAAIDAWRQAVEAAGDVYAPDLMMGSRATTKYDIDYRLSGHWRDELPHMEKGLQDLRQLRGSLGPAEEQRNSPAFEAAGFTPLGELYAVDHQPVRKAAHDQDLHIGARITAPAGVKWVRLRFRPVNQHFDYATLEMKARPGSDYFEATIPAAEINPAFDLMYFIELMDTAGNGRIYPDLDSETPYIVVELDRPEQHIAYQEDIPSERDGVIVVEAEDFIRQSLVDKRHWYVISANSPPSTGRDEDPPHLYDAGSCTYLEILPDTRVTHDDKLIRGQNFSNVPGVMGVLHYKVNFSEPGRYYVWVRAHSTGSEDNGIHVGLNGEWPASGQRMQWCEGKRSWRWESKQRTDAVHCGEPYLIYLDVEEAGEHEIQFSMREDGFEFDRFLLTRNRDYIPQGVEPAGDQAAIGTGKQGPHDCLHASQQTAVFQQQPDDTTVAIEAENYTRSTHNGHSFQWAATSHWDVFSGEDAMSTTNGGETIASTDAIYESPRLDYRVNFVQPGSYYVWVRGSGPDQDSDSIHVGLNGMVSSGQGMLLDPEAAWSNSSGRERVTITVPSPGIYSFSLWVHEDGAVVDKIVLTPNQALVPDGTGPAETARTKELTNYEGPWGRVPKILENVIAPVFPNRRFEVTEYGADALGKSDSFKAFKDAIEACNAAGGGRVIVPPGDYLVNGPITLLSNVNLHLDEGAHVRFGTNPDDYLPVVRLRYIGYEGYSYSPLLYAYKQKNIAVTGKGVLDGQASKMWQAWKNHPESDTGPWREAVFDNVPIEERRYGKGYYLRPDMLQFHTSRNILLEDFTIRDAPFWVVHPVLCENAIIRRLTIDTNNSNNDGVDPDSCRNVLVEDIVFEKAGDDAVAVKAGKGPEAWRNRWKTEDVYVRNLDIVYGDDNGLCIGSDISGGVRNLFAENITMDRIKLNAIYLKSKPSNHGLIDGVWFRNITINEVERENVISIRMNYKGQTEGDNPTTYENINISNLSCKNASDQAAIYLVGNQNSHIGQRTPVTLENVVIGGAKIPEEITYTDQYVKRDVVISAPRSAEVRNPIIPGFNADPSIVRVDGDFYLATSTFEYFPGVPIYHSRNLVNWDLIGHALHRPSQLDLDGVGASQGIHAPTLRHHDGRFYMITTHIAPDRGGKPKGNFYVTADNPAGPWSEPNWLDNAPGIDPSLFFDDDGKVYYTGNSKLSSFYTDDPDKAAGAMHPKHRLIWTQELDLESGQLVGPRSVLDPKPYFESGLLGSVTSMEGPHLYKKDGVYYLLASHGGTGENHAVSIWRGESPHGPWELNPDSPIVTHRDYAESGIAATGHADIVQTQHGDWWIVMLAVRSTDGVRSPMGRETFLAPVDWSGEWPIVSPNQEPGRIGFIVPHTGLPAPEPVKHDFFDDFDASQLKLDWNFIRTPRTRWWDLESRPGKLRMKLRPDTIAQHQQPSFLGVRVPQATASLSASLKFNPQAEGEQAGLAIERSHEAHWELVKELLGGKPVLSAYDDGVRIASTGDILTGPVQLRIQLQDFQVSYFFLEDSGDWQRIAVVDAGIIGYPRPGRYTGAAAGPYASSNGRHSDNTAEFEWVRLQVEDG